MFLVAFPDLFVLSPSPFVRPSGFYALNVFLSIPSESAADTLNHRYFLKSHIETCSSIYDEDANVVFVDYWHVGNVPELVQGHNQALGLRAEEAAALATIEPSQQTEVAVLSTSP